MRRRKQLGETCAGSKRAATRARREASGSYHGKAGKKKPRQPRGGWGR